MTFNIRTLGAVTLLATAALIPHTACAQAADWPTKPVRYVVPFSTGGVSDGVARLIAQHLGERLGQPVVVENKPGVSGIVGTQYVARAPADGYTLMGGTITTHAVNPFFSKTLGYDPVKDFVPVNLVGMVSNVLVVPAGSRFDSVQQITAELKAKPESLTYGTAGAGTSQHLSGQLYQSLTGTQLRQIVYKGGSQAMVDLVGGQIDMVFETVAAARPMIDAKRVKVLGVTSKARLADLPGVPSLPRPVSRASRCSPGRACSRPPARRSPSSTGWRAKWPPSSPRPTCRPGCATWAWSPTAACRHRSPRSSAPKSPSGAR